MNGSNGWRAATSADTRGPATWKFGKNRFIGRQDDRELNRKGTQAGGKNEAPQDANEGAAPAGTQPRVYASRAAQGRNAVRGRAEGQVRGKPDCTANMRVKLSRGRIETDPELRMLDLMLEGFVFLVRLYRHHLIAILRDLSFDRADLYRCRA